jgi:hypothetical protein
MPAARSKLKRCRAAGINDNAGGNNVHVALIKNTCDFFLIQTMPSSKRPTSGKAAATAPSAALSAAAARKARQQNAKRHDKRSMV